MNVDQTIIGEPNEDTPIEETYQWKIRETKLMLALQSRGVRDVQVFIKANGPTDGCEGPIRVQFRNKWTCEQWSMTPEKCDTMMSLLPEKLTRGLLVAALRAVPGVKFHPHPGGPNSVPQPKGAEL